MNFDDLTISRKIVYAFASIIVCSVGVSGIVWGDLDELKQASSWDAHTSDVIQNIDTASKAMVDIAFQTASENLATSRRLQATLPPLRDVVMPVIDLGR